MGERIRMSHLCLKGALKENNRGNRKRAVSKKIMAKYFLIIEKYL